MNSRTLEAYTKFLGRSGVEEFDLHQIALLNQM
jgi:hypothetical protein